MRRIFRRFLFCSLLFHAFVACWAAEPPGALSRSLASRRPELAAQVLLVAEEAVKGASVVERAIPAEGLVAVVAAKRAEGGLSSLTDITPAAGETQLRWKAPEGDWVILKFYTRRLTHLDPLNRDAVSAFLERASGYSKDEFASACVHFLPPDFGLKGLVWTGDFFESFREVNGFELCLLLPALFYDVEGASSAVKVGYFKTLSRLFSERFLRAVSQHADRLGLAAPPPIAFGLRLSDYTRLGSPFELLPRLPNAGLTSLRLEGASGPACLKLIESCLATSQTSRRALAPICPRGKIFADIKRAALLRSLCGTAATAVCPAASRAGEEMFLFGAVMRYGDLVSRYIESINGLTANAKPHPDVAVLLPTTTFWANHPWSGSSEINRDVEGYIVELASCLMSNQFDFLFVDDDLLSQCRVSDGRLQLGDIEFRALILPPATTVSKATADRMREFGRSGGTVISLVNLPAEIVDGKSVVSAEGLMLDLFGLSPSDSPSKDVYSKGSCHFVAEDVSKIVPLLRPVADDFFIYPSTDELYFSHFRSGKADLYFVVNLSRFPFETYATVRQQRKPEIIEPETGSATDVHGYQVLEDKIIVPLSLEPCAAVVLKFEKPLPDRYIRRVSGLRITRVEQKGDGLLIRGLAHMNGACSVVLSDGKKASARVKDLPAPYTIETEWRFETERPFERSKIELRRARVMLADKGTDTSEWCKPNFDDSGWKEVEIGQPLGLEVARWKGQWLRFSDKYRTAFFRRVFDLPDEVKKAEVSIAVDDGYELFVNGEKVGEEKGGDGWKRAERYDVSSYLRKGKNLLCVRAINTSGLGAVLLELQVLLKSDELVTIASDADWRMSPSEVKKAPESWLKLDFDDSAWLKCEAVGSPPKTPPWRVIEGSPPNLKLLHKRLWYRFRIPASAVSVILRGVRGDVAAFVGGKRVGVEKGRVDLSGVAPDARSLLVLSVSGGSPLIQPPVCDCSRGVVSLGAWEEAGYRGYSGAATYRATVNIPARLAREHLVLDLGEVRFTAEVYVNGKYVGTRLWAPYRFDIDGYVHEGKNEIEVIVSNTIRTALDGAGASESGEAKSGLIGAVRIVPLREVELKL